MKITAELLCAKGACTDQIALFRKLYPKGKNVTLAACLRHATRFNWRWATRNLLSAPAQKACIKEIDTALEAYAKARLAAREAYAKASRAARGAYDRKCAAAWEARDKASLAVRGAYDHRKCAAAWEARDKYPDGDVPAGEARDKALTAALKARDKVLTPALEARDKVIAAALVAYYKARAAAFARASLSE